MIYDISLPENPALIKKIKLIKNFEPFCLTLYDHYLYTGGRWHGDNEKSTHFSAGFYNIKEKKPEWKSIPIPREYTARRKAVDDILIQSGSLYLLDNLVYPKYILTYTVMSDETLIPGEVIQLAANGPNEQIKKGFITSRYFGFHSTAFGSWDFGYHINIYKTEDFSSVFSIGCSENSINDFIIINNSLYFIFNCYSIGVLEIKDSFFLKINHDFASLYLNLDKQEDLDTITIKSVASS